MNEKIKTILTEGLLNGYLGSSSPQSEIRGRFPVKTNHLESENGVYHDEWIARKFGGGQEIVKVDNEVFTRLYAGGIRKNLERFNTSEEKVIDFLKKSIQEAEEKIRIFENYSLTGKNGYRYTYSVKQYEGFPLFLGEENISVNKIPVFIHYFILCPID